MKKISVFSKPAYVRTHALPRRALGRVMVDMAARGMTFGGASITQEALVNASWELLEEMGPDWCEAKLTPILRRMERYGEDQAKQGDSPARGEGSLVDARHPIPARPATGSAGSGGKVKAGGEDSPVGAEKRAPSRKK